jgi:L-fuculose-phosphate aldolase
MTETEMRRSLMEGCREAYRLGLNSGTAGNFSLRTRAAMLITPTGIPDGKLTSEMIVSCGFDGSYDGRWLPSSEWEMHAEIYKAYPAAQAIVHAHPDNCVALSCLREDLPPFHYMIASFGGKDVRCSRYERFGSGEIALAAVEALEGRNACLLANHGMICFSGSIEKAVSNAVKLEILTRQYLLARSVGSPALLTDVELSKVNERYATYGQQPAASR